MTYSTYRTATAAISGAVLIALCVPMLSRAEMISQGSFCNNLSTIQERAMERHTERVNARESRRSDTSNAFAERKTERLGTLDANRDKADDARTTQYAKLEAAAATDAQKAAVATFKTTIEDAVVARRASIDSAIGTFEATMQDLWTDRKSDSDSFAGDLETALTEAFANAETRCREEDPGTVREELRVALTELTESFRERARNMAHPEEVQAARATLRESTDAAWKTFRTTKDEATAALRAALKV